jgi:integrase/recombinase XerD
VDRYFNEFQEHLMINEKSENTSSSYISDLKQFFIFFTKDISEINQIDIINYKKYMVNKGHKAITRNRNLTAINKYIEFLNNKKGHAISLNFKKEKVQKQNYLKEMLSKTDYRRILGVAERNKDLRAVALFQLMYLTGMRVSETLQYKVKDVGKDKVTVIGKGNKEREVIIPLKLIEALANYAAVRVGNSDNLFITKNGNMSRKMVDYIVKFYGSKAKVKYSKCHAHNFRHLFAIICIVERKMSLDVVADLLGHEDINITRIYTRMTQEELMKIVEVFE